MKANDTPDLEPDDPPTELLANPSATPSTGGEEVANGLLALIGEVTKLSVLLAESDTDEMALVYPRLMAFQALVAGLPTTGRKRKVIGFGEPKTKAKRRRGATSGAKGKRR